MSWQGNLTDGTNDINAGIARTWADDVADYFTKQTAGSPTGNYYVIGMPEYNPADGVWYVAFSDGSTGGILNYSTGEIVITLFSGQTASYPSPIYIQDDKAYICYGYLGSAYHKSKVSSIDLSTKEETVLHTQSVSRNSASYGMGKKNYCSMVYDATYLYFSNSFDEKNPSPQYQYRSYICIFKVTKADDTVSYIENFAADGEGVTPYSGLSLTSSYVYYGLNHTEEGAYTFRIDLDGANKADVSTSCIRGGIYGGFAFSSSNIFLFSAGAVSKTWSLLTGVAYFLNTTSPYYVLFAQEGHSLVRIYRLNADETVTSVKTLVEDGLGNYCKIPSYTNILMPYLTTNGQRRSRFIFSGSDGSTEVNIPWEDFE